MPRRWWNCTRQGRSASTSTQTSSVALAVVGGVPKHPPATATNNAPPPYQYPTNTILRLDRRTGPGRAHPLTIDCGERSPVKPGGDEKGDRFLSRAKLRLCGAQIGLNS